MKKIVLFIMPFGTKETIDFEEKYNKYKKMSCFKNFDVYKVDNISGTNIDSKMYKSILSADIVIADLTIYNPNVMYELGIRHSFIEQKTILIRNKNGNIPFDINHLLVLDAESKNLSKEISKLISAQENDSTIRNLIKGLPTILNKHEHKKVFTNYEANWQSIYARLKAFKDKKEWLKGVKYLSENTLFSKNQDVLNFKALFTYKVTELCDEEKKLKGLIEAKGILEELKPYQNYSYESSGLYISIINKINYINKTKKPIIENFNFALTNMFIHPTAYSITQFYIAAALKLLVIEKNVNDFNFYRKLAYSKFGEIKNNNSDDMKWTNDSKKLFTCHESQKNKFIDDAKNIIFNILSSYKKQINKVDK